MLTASTLMTVPLAWTIEGPPDLSLSIRTWLAIGYYSIVATAFAYLLYYRVLAMAGSGNLLLCTLLVSPVAIALGALVLGEALAPKAIVGFGILAAGLLILDGRILRWRNRPDLDPAPMVDSTGRASR
jgi:drug/metabolite transporter (DMT)-like permease